MTQPLHRRTFELFGVSVSLMSEDHGLLEDVVSELCGFFPTALAWKAKGTVSDYDFRFAKNGPGYVLESPFGSNEIEVDAPGFLRFIRTLVRVVIASNAKEHLFIHAGVVGIGQRALLLPADSYSGKTTLVKALVQQGATYMSDEYAVIDRDGKIVPFPKALSVRGIDGPNVQKDIPPEELGAKIGRTSLPVGWIIFTQYRKGAHWGPREVSQGIGRMSLIPHMIGLVQRPEFGLKMLEKSVSNAIFLKSDRGDAVSAARKILQTLDKFNSLDYHLP